MRRFRVRLLLAVLAAIAVPALVSGQSLSEVARKERARREKNRKNGVAAREFTDEVLDEGAKEADSGKEAEEREADAAAGEGEDAEAPQVRSDVQRVNIELEPPEADDLEDEDRERKRREAEFRSRYRTAKERVEAARERKKVLDGIHWVEGMKFVDENGSVAIESLAHLRRLVEEANAELRNAEAGVKRLEEEARRGGYPPGWLR